MLRYVFRRLLTAIPTLFVIVTISFFLIRVAPGGPFNQERGLNPVIKANLDRQFGLDQPLWMQYLRYLNNLLHGDFGPSYNLPDFTVAELFKVGLPVSIQLGASALILALLIGGTLGIIAALKQNKGADYAVIATATAGSTIPTFVIAPLYQLLFATTLALVPVATWGGGALVNKIGPIVTLALPQIAIVARLMRGSMIEALRSHHIRTARALGPFRLEHHHQACLAWSAAADRLLFGTGGGGLAHRLDHRRDDFPDSGCRALFRRSGAQPRLHAGDGNGGGDRDLHHPVQPHRRHPLCRGRSEGAL